MKKLNKYQKRYIWNHKRASRENVTWHDIHVWAAESEPHKPVQRMLSAKHLLSMPTYVTTEMNEESVMSSLRSIMGYNK